jgi:hypothetical protein
MPEAAYKEGQPSEPLKMRDKKWVFLFSGVLFKKHLFDK